MISNEIAWCQMKSRETKWTKVKSNEINWTQMTSSEFRWNQINSNEIHWNQMNSNGTQINQMNSMKSNWVPPPPSPQSSYPTLVGFIGIYIYISEVGGLARQAPRNREIVSCRAVRAYVRARGAWSSEISGKSWVVLFPFSLMPRPAFPFSLLSRRFFPFPLCKHMFPFPLWAPWRNGFKWNQVNSYEFKWNHMISDEITWIQMS